jgi:N-acetylglucosaminyldiphosphoundecaprenol N-acetyl-beta-D-mannosaminyltransferase
MTRPARFNVLGIGVHALQLASARALIIDAAMRQRKTAPSTAATFDASSAPYVCFCDVNSISCGQRDPAHAAALNRAHLATPDGMPLVWLGRRAGFPEIGRVYGPDLLLEICAATANPSLASGGRGTHFFYGGGAGTAELLANNLQTRFPGLRIAGVRTPPFRELDATETDALVAAMHALRPDFFWVGLSTPKQEKFMATFAPRFGDDVGVLLGVGAAFDFLSGRVRQAPRWLRGLGLEWLFRLCAEPRRLAPRYFRNNPLFVARVLAQASGLKKYPEPETR